MARIPESEIDRLKDEVSVERLVGASGVALIPVPMADLVGISLTQMRMVQKLSELYKIPFNENQCNS